MRRNIVSGIKFRMFIRKNRDVKAERKNIESITVLADNQKDWYDLEFMYLKSNPLFEAFRIYRESKDIRNTYVDFSQKMLLKNADCLY